MGGCCMGLCEELVSCWVSFSLGGHSGVGVLGGVCDVPRFLCVKLGVCL